MQVKSIFLIAGLVIVAATSMIVAGNMDAASLSPGVSSTLKAGLLKGEVRLVQQKLLKGSDGQVVAAVTLTSDADIVSTPREEVRRPVDLTIVLDRSGSMSGEKIGYAKEALVKLLDDLSEKDRLALVSYANDAVVHSGLAVMTPENRERMRRAVSGINVGGGTNLGAGLMAGINAMSQVEDELTIRHLLVISDGLANQGITDPAGLGQLAAGVGGRGISVGTVGVGIDFNEQLLTLLADRGQGRYYFLENPVAFAGLFTEAYRHLGLVAATEVSLSIEAGPNVTLVDAAGYPIEKRGQEIVIRPGNIRAGDTRTLYLTFQVPTHKTGAISLGRMKLAYRHKGRAHILPVGSEMTIACVENPKEVWASVEKESWTRKVLENDFNLLKKKVAGDIRKGDATRAMERLESYRSKQAAANAVVGSAAVKENLDFGVESLKQQIQETFSGAPDQVEEKQKSVSKSLHYQGYKGQRAVK